MNPAEPELKVEMLLNNKTEWTIEHEQILVEWADKAMCYRWLHSKSNAMYSYLNAWYTIPVIVISTLTGTANFAQGRVPIMYQGAFAMIVGGFNILAGIITTIQQFLKITQFTEAHRVSSIAWDKFYRNIKIELAKHPDERMNVLQMIKISKEEFDRLMETSPNIPDNIILKFKTEFINNVNNINNANYYETKIITPEICDELISTEMSRNPWFSEENKYKRATQLVTKDAQNITVVTNFQNTFYDINNREAMDNEIIDNLKDIIEVGILIKTIEIVKKTKKHDSLQLLSQNV
jgi:hypothetical protein